MREPDKNNLGSAPDKEAGPIVNAGGRAFEITGLGAIAALMLAFWTLVADGTMPLSQYLVFVAMLLVSAAGMVWRLCNLGPQSEAVAHRLPPGAYRVVFGHHDSQPS
jgi:hypothetical protein